MNMQYTGAFCQRLRCFDPIKTFKLEQICGIIKAAKKEGVEGAEETSYQRETDLIIQRFCF